MAEMTQDSDKTNDQTEPLHPGIRPRAENRPECLSVVVPCYNEQDNLDPLHDRLVGVLRDIDQPYEIVLVNDGSRDGTIAAMHALRARDPNVVVVDLSRNFGQNIAVTAGIDHARGDALILLDADLQDPPELIPALIEGWREGYDVVYGQRRSRAGETWLKRKTADLFYRLMARIGPVELPRNTGDFRLLSRPAIEAVKALREHHRFLKGLFAWVGFPAKAVPFDREPRHAGETKYNYWRLWNLSLDGITSFTVAPLKIATYLGVALSLVAFAAAFGYIIERIFFGSSAAGFPTLITAILLIGGVQLIFLGLIGEYLGRVFNESKRRPLYFVREVARRDDRAHDARIGDSKPVREVSG